MKVIYDIKQGSEEWHGARMNKVTGTKAKNIMGTPTAYWNQVAEFIAEEGTGRSKFVRATEEMERGNSEEVFAQKHFTEVTGKEVETVAMCISDENPMWTYSPDGLIKIDGEYKEGIEIKSMDSKNHIMNIIKNEVEDVSDSLPKGQRNICGVPSEYIWQVVHSFLVNERQEVLNFLYWDSRFLSEDWQLKVERVRRDDPIIEGMIQEEKLKLERFEDHVNRIRPLILKNNF